MYSRMQLPVLQVCRVPFSAAETILKSFKLSFLSLKNVVFQDGWSVHIAIGLGMLKCRLTARNMHVVLPYR